MLLVPERTKEIPKRRDLVLMGRKQDEQNMMVSLRLDLKHNPRLTTRLTFLYFPKLSTNP
jgi:hypothetical protein